jgi:hypothetical protein
LLVAALTGDAAARSDGLAFAVGAGFVAFAALADRRGVQLRRYVEEPGPLPADALHDPSWRLLTSAAFPSTFGVTALAVIALVAGKDLLGALLGGVVAGLGIASAIGLIAVLVWEHEHGVNIYVGANGRRYVDDAGKPKASSRRTRE